MNAAADGYRIEIGTGVYREQVDISGFDNLTIRPVAGNTVTIEAPNTLVQTSTASAGYEIFAVVTVEDSTNVVIENVTIDGRGITTGLAGVDPEYSGVAYRNASGAVTNVNVTGIRDPYEPGTTVGGEPLVSGLQRGVAVRADNDDTGPRLAFTMTGGSITDFQKNAAQFVHADINISGVTITGGGAQTINAQNGIQASDSTGTISGNTITEIGYAGPAFAYSGSILAFDNTDLDIVNNVIAGTNNDTADAKVVGVFVFNNSETVDGGTISGNTISHVDTGVGVYGDVGPGAPVVNSNTVTGLDLADPFAAGVDFEPNAGFASALVVAGSAEQDILWGSDGADSLSGLGGDDTFAGGAGADVLIGGAGDDALDGGIGADAASYAGGAAVAVSLAIAGAQNTLGQGTDTLSSIEDLIGSSFNDTLTGDGGANTLNGATGADILVGAAGADQLLGGAGNDLVYYDAADVLANVLGGADFDTLFVNAGVNATGFDLAAHEFEQGLVYGTDPGGNPWTNYYQYFRPGWVLDYQDTNYDNGTRQVRYNDYAANQSWSSYTDHYAAGGALEARQTSFDNGRSQVQTFDTGAPDPYSSYIDYFNAGGQRDATRVFNDDGTYATTYFDLASNPWSRYTDFNAATGQLIARQTINDNSSYSNTFFDAFNANPWAQYTDFFNAAGAFIGRSGINDNGTLF